MVRFSAWAQLTPLLANGIVPPRQQILINKSTITGRIAIDLGISWIVFFFNLGGGGQKN